MRCGVGRGSGWLNISTFPNKLGNRAAATIARSARLVQAAHQRLNTQGSQIASLTPGSWQALTLEAGWTNVAGYIPAQVRIQQSGVALLVGHIQGGAVANGTLIATLSAGYYNAVHAHSFTANVLAGAAAVSVSGSVSGTSDTAGLTDGTINGSTDTAGLPDGTIGGTSASAAGPGSHTHGDGSYAVSNGMHSHAGNSGGGSLAVANGDHGHTSSALVPAVPVNYNTVILTVATNGEVTLSNCSASATQLSFNEQLPLVTS
jgi:hypothetical protein